MSETTSTSYSGLQPNSSESAQTGSTRHSNVTEPVSSKRICFYKSGDPQFNGIKMVISNRSFKTFDALLDGLSKRVPLPFGVRNISTPRGIHQVSTLEELEDGKSYICSHQKKIKPINLDLASKKPLLWQSSRPISSRRRVVQLLRQNEVNPAPRDNTVASGLSKKLVIFRNGDTRFKHTIILNKKTTQHFEAFLDHMTEVMQCPVLKLYTADGRRILGIQALLFSSGTIVAGGREPFKPGNYDTEKESLPMKLPGIPKRVLPKAKNKPEGRTPKPRASNSKSPVHSISSDKMHTIDMNGIDLPYVPENDMNVTENHACAEEDLPLMHSEDDIEKSVHVNPDGTMTVEMKIRLKIKSDETIKWTTTVSRANVASKSNTMISSNVEPGAQSPAINGSGQKTQQEVLYLENCHKTTDIPVTQTHCTEKEPEQCSETGSSAICPNPPTNLDTSTIILWDKCKPRFHRPPTPGPRKTRQKQAIINCMTKVADGKVRGNIRQFSYSEEMEDGEYQSQYCMVTQSSSQMPSMADQDETNDKDGAHQISLQDNKDDEMLIHFRHKSTRFVDNNNKSNACMPRQEGPFNGFLENADCMTNVSPCTSTARTHQDDRPRSADSACLRLRHCDIKEIKRSQSTLARCSEFSESNNEETCVSLNCVCSSDSVDTLVYMKNNLTNMVNMVVSPSGKMASQARRPSSGSCPVSTGSPKASSDSLERNVCNDSSRNQLALAAEGHMKKRKQSHSPPAEKKIDTDQVKEGKHCAEEGLFKRDDMSQGSCLTSENKQESRARGPVSSAYEASFQNTVTNHTGNSGEEKVRSISPKNEKLPKEDDHSIVDMGSQNCKVRPKGNKQMAKVKPRPIKKASLPPTAKGENALEGKPSQRSDIRHNLNPLGSETEGPHHICDSQKAIAFMNVVEGMNSVYPIHNPLLGRVNGTHIEKPMGEAMEVSENAPKLTKKQKKRKKNKKRTGLYEGNQKITAADHKPASLQPDECAQEICHHSLENYVQSWLQNIFPNTALPENKCNQLNAACETENKSSIDLEPINTCSDKDTQLAKKSEVSIIECSWKEETSRPIAETEVSSKESLATFSGRQAGSVSSAAATTVEKTEALSYVGTRQDANVEEEMFYDVSEIEGTKTKLKVDIQGINIAIRMHTVDVAVQADAEFVSGTETEADATKHCMSDWFLCCPQSSKPGVQKAVPQCRCLERSLSPEDAPSTAVSSSPHLLLAWLIVLNLKDSLTSILQNDRLHNGYSSAGILTLLQSLKQIAITEKADDLRTAVLSLHESTLNYEVESQHLTHRPDSLSTGEIQSAPQMHEEGISPKNNMGIICFSNKGEHNIEEVSGELGRSGDVQEDTNVSTASEHLGDLGIFSAPSDREHADVDARTNILALMENQPEKMQSSASASFCLKSQNKDMNTSSDEDESYLIYQSFNTREKDCTLQLQNMDTTVSVHVEKNEITGDQETTEPATKVTSKEELDVFSSSSTMDGHQSKCLENKKEVGGLGAETTHIFSPPSSTAPCSRSEHSVETETQTVQKPSKVKMIVQEMEHRRHSDAPFETRKCLQSPISSDWSDYRQDSDESTASDWMCKASSEVNTESGEDTVQEKPYKTGFVKRTIERLYGKAEASLKPSHSTGPPTPPKIASKDSWESPGPGLKDISSPGQDVLSPDKEAMSRPSSSSDNCRRNQNQHANAESIDNSPLPLLQPIKAGEVFNCDRNGPLNKSDAGNACLKHGSKTSIHSEDDAGMLIDKGRWLLKENHLARRSPPENTGMYGNVDTTSADTMFDNTSDDMPYSHFKNRNHHLLIAEVSSSELEDLAKPHSFSCNYFSMPHGSDSEPFHDDLHIKSKNKLVGNTLALPSKKEKETFSAGMCTGPTQRNSEASASTPVRTAVEFRLPGNKVHPQVLSSNEECPEDQPSNINREQVKEQDSLDRLHLICGQHCPILTAIIQPVNEKSRGFAYCKASDFENQLVLHSTSTSKEGTGLLGIEHCPSIDENNNVFRNKDSITKHMLIKNIFDRLCVNSMLNLNKGVCATNAEILLGDNNLKACNDVLWKTYIISLSRAHIFSTKELNANRGAIQCYTNTTCEHMLCGAKRDINNNLTCQQWSASQRLITHQGHALSNTCSPSPVKPSDYVLSGENAFKGITKEPS